MNSEKSVKRARTPVLFSWSGGKDSAMALHRVLQSEQYEVVALLTTINGHFKRVSMHGVREELVDAQAASIGLPLEKMFVSERSTNVEYGERMREILLRYKARGVEHVVFGDIFLADLRAWREANLAQVGMQAIFPLWREDTTQLVNEFHALGFRAVICCANDAYLGEQHAGAELDATCVRGLPAGVDPCGENGEYHSFVFAGPIFKAPIPIVVGEKIYRPLEETHPGVDAATLGDAAARPVTRGFWFCDLVEGGAPSA